MGTIAAGHLVRRMIEAARHGDLPALCQALEDGANPGTCGENGANALVEAAHYGHQQVVEHLLGYAPHVLNFPGIRQQTALITASRAGHLAIVRRLLEAGADAHRRDKHDDTALHHACRQGWTPIVAALLEYDPALMYLPGNRGSMALNLEVSAEFLEAIDFLLAQGASVRICEHAGWYSLDFEAANGARGFVLRLLKHDPELLEHPGRAGGTAHCLDRGAALDRDPRR